ncbi:hypothetical protein MBANPS3_010402 [Mucor bainieri]
MFVIKRSLQLNQKRVYPLAFQQPFKQPPRHALPLLPHHNMSMVQRRALSIWTIPKIILATQGKKSRGLILGTLGAATFLSSFLGPVVWVTAKSWWNYLTPSQSDTSTSSSQEPSLAQMVLSRIGTHHAEELVRTEAIKSLKNYFETSSKGKQVLEEFGLDHPRDLVWEDVHRSETVRLDGDGKKHRVSVNFWLEDQTSKGPKGGSCEVTASALVSGQGNIDLEQVKLSSPDWHQDEVISLA